MRLVKKRAHGMCSVRTFYLDQAGEELREILDFLCRKRRVRRPRCSKHEDRFFPEFELGCARIGHQTGMGQKFLRFCRRCSRLCRAGNRRNQLLLCRQPPIPGGLPRAYYCICLPAFRFCMQSCKYHKRIVRFLPSGPCHFLLKLLIGIVHIPPALCQPSFVNGTIG